MEKQKKGKKVVQKKGKNVIRIEGVVHTRTNFLAISSPLPTAEITFYWGNISTDPLIPRNAHGNFISVSLSDSYSYTAGVKYNGVERMIEMDGSSTGERKPVNAGLNLLMVRKNW